VLVLLAAFAAGVVAQGGYYLQGRTLLTVLVGVALLAALWAHPWTRADHLPVLACGAALAAWILVRAALADDYPTAIAAVATLACFCAVLVVLLRTDALERERTAHAVIGLGVLVAVTAWAGVAWRLPRLAVLVEHRVWRGASTLTYPNAAAALLVPLALLAIALLIAPREAVDHRSRAIRAAAAYLLLVGVGATLSRAGVIALLVGLIVLAAIAGVRATGWQVAPLALGAAIAVGALLPAVPADTAPRPGLAVLGLLVGGAVAVGVGRLSTRPAVAVLATTVALGGLAMWTQLGSGYLHDVLRSRGTLASSGRTGATRAAFELVAQYPLTGTGMGRARFFWSTDDGNGAVALYVHNEYLQMLVDVGVIGMVLLLCLLGAVAVTVRRGRTGHHRPGVRVGALAALAALAVHSAFDFLWHIPVLVLAAGLFVGLAGAATREGTVPVTKEETQ